MEKVYIFLTFDWRYFIQSLTEEFILFSSWQFRRTTVTTLSTTSATVSVLVRWCTAWFTSATYRYGARLRPVIVSVQVQDTSAESPAIYYTQNSCISVCPGYDFLQFLNYQPLTQLPTLLFHFQEKLTLTDMGILMTAAVCHDLDHPGYNNT